MVNNTKLKDCLQSLAQSTLSLYNEYLPPDKLELSSNELPHIYISLGKLDQKVTENPEFSTCIRLMEKDKKIKALHGQLVGTLESAMALQDEKVSILSFLQQLYIKNPTYEQCLFDQDYSSFEELFYSDTLRFRDTSCLFNFQYSSNVVELGHGLNISRTTMPIDPQEAYIERMQRSYVTRSKSDFVIERLYDRNKTVGDITRPNKQEVEEGLSKTGDLFDSVIATLRILKPSAVFRDHRISSELMTFHPTRGTITTIPFFENIAVGEKCVIEDKDIPELETNLTFLINESDSRFNVAQRRLSLGIERKNLEDRLIDYMIGLEALYLPDGNQELSFRLSLRMAFLLYTDPIERKRMYYFAREMYKTRSNIVHGNKYDLNVDETSKLEELLRRSLKLWIKEKSKFSVNKLSHSGKLQSEGELDNLFFDA